MNPLKALTSWWRGPTDPETLASEVDARHVQENRQTIRLSQSSVGKQAGGSLIAAPTPDVLDPESDRRTDSR